MHVYLQSIRLLAVAGVAAGVGWFGVKVASEGGAQLYVASGPMCSATEEDCPLLVTELEEATDAGHPFRLASGHQAIFSARVQFQIPETAPGAEALIVGGRECLYTLGLLAFGCQAGAWVETMEVELRGARGAGLVTWVRKVK